MRVKLTRSELILLTILFVGLFLRLYHLSGESIWLDEAFSIKLANSSLLEIIEGSAEDAHPPLYYILLRHWINFFGDSEFSTRFMSVVFGTFAIFLIYKVGTLIFDVEVGILSALLLALSNFHIFYSQEARMYSLMALLTLLSIYFFLKILKNRNLISSVGYILSSILLIYTHNFGLFIIIAQNIYIFTLFLFSKDDCKLSWRKWVLLQLILIVMFSPWILVLVKQILQTRSESSKTIWIPMPSIHTIIKSFKLYSGSYLLLLLCFFLILSCFSMVKCKKPSGSMNRKDLFESIKSYEWKIYPSNIKTGYFLLVWLLTPIVMPFIISKFFTTIYWYRYTIVASLAFYLLVAIGIKNIGQKYLKFTVILVVILGSIANVWQSYSTVHKERWREIVDYIDTNAKQGDLLLFNADYSQIPFDYYSKRKDLVKRPFPEETIFLDEDNIKKLESTVKGYKRVWVIRAYSGDSQDLIRRRLGESYNFLSSGEYGGMSYASNDEYHKVEASLFEKK